MVAWDKAIVLQLWLIALLCCKACLSSVCLNYQCLASIGDPDMVDRVRRHSQREFLCSLHDLTRGVHSRNAGPTWPCESSFATAAEDIVSTSSSDRYAAGSAASLRSPRVPYRLHVGRWTTLARRTSPTIDKASQPFQRYYRSKNFNVGTSSNT